MLAAPAPSNGRYRSSWKLNSKTPASLRAELVAIDCTRLPGTDVRAPAVGRSRTVLLSSVRVAPIVVYEPETAGIVSLTALMWRRYWPGYARS